MSDVGPVGPGRTGSPALVVVDASGRVVLVDHAAALALRRAPGDLVGQDVFEFMAAEQRMAVRSALRQAARAAREAVTGPSEGLPPEALPGEAGGRAAAPGAVGVPPPGSIGLLTPDEAGLDVHVMATASAVGPLELHQRQAAMAAIAWECDEAILSTGPGGLIQTWNHAAEELFGWDEDEVLGTAASVMVPPERQGEAAELMSRAWAGGKFSRVETVRMGKHGSRVEVSISLGPLRDGTGQVVGVFQVVRDITQQKASERALAYQALHDHLTGLPNRSLLEDRMAHALERCRREGGSVGVIFFDLDHLKTVNDTAGHEVGDELLRAVAVRMRQSVRSVDTVARMGGDEFVVLCEDITDDAQLDVIVSHIMRGFSDPVLLPGRQLWVSASAGVVRGGASSSVAQLLSQADAAMYQAKARARGSVGHYDPRIRPDLERRAEGSRLLRLALEAQQLVPYYQPIIDLHSGTVVGVEALARWLDPVRGIVAAKNFVPLAEELGLVGEIGDIVLAEAAQRAEEWSVLSPGLRVMVNISALQLRGTALLASARALLEGGTRAASLVMEVTESALMEDTGASRAVLAELRDAGFGIAIDDFGTGYSSLAYLKQLPATAIKVDQAFTSQLPDPQDLSVVMAILAIADAYGLEVTAEGIETAEQAEILKSLGCQQGQGYYFGRPVPADEFTRWLVEPPGLGLRP